MHGERIDAVIAPVPRTRELSDRHQLDCSHAQITKPFELPDRPIKGSFCAERSHMQLVDDPFRELRTLPAMISPVECWLDHGRPAVHPFRLESRRRVGSLATIPNVEQIAIGRLNICDHRGVVAVRFKLERDFSSVPNKLQRYLRHERRPNAKTPFVPLHKGRPNIGRSQGAHHARSPRTTWNEPRTARIDEQNSDHRRNGNSNSAFTPPGHWALLCRQSA